LGSGRSALIHPTVSMYLPLSSDMLRPSSCRQSRMWVCPPRIKIGVSGCTARMTLKTSGPVASMSVKTDAGEQQSQTDSQLSRETGMWPARRKTSGSSLIASAN
jgi:hypothetical protein